MRKVFILLLLILACVQTEAQPRMRVIVDNDFGGDPDGLFQLAHQVLSPSAEIRAIVGSHHYDDFFGNPGTSAFACKMAKEVLSVMHCDSLTVYVGAEGKFTNIKEPLESEGARAIIAEAMREDKRPLYVLCGAGLTNIAAAYLMEPRIAERITAVVWIGGPEYADLCRNQLQKQREYNQGIDPIASQVVFNHSNLHIWQIPRDVYRQALYSYPELEECIGKSGKTGNYLMERLAVPFKWMHGGLGETYILGDSPLVLVTALLSPWESDPSSCEYVIRKTPFMNDNGFYNENPTGRPIRIFTRIDGRLMFEDLIAKLKQHD